MENDPRYSSESILIFIDLNIRKSSSVNVSDPSPGCSGSSFCGLRPISSFSVSSISKPASRNLSIAAATLGDCWTDSFMAVPTSSASFFVYSSISKSLVRPLISDNACQMLCHRGQIIQMIAAFGFSMLAFDCVFRKPPATPRDVTHGCQAQI